MPSEQRFLFFVLIISTISFLFSRTNGQYPKKEKFFATREDVGRVRCETCQRAIKHIFRKTHEMREKSSPKQLEEEKIMELVESSCNPDKEDGEWISKFDIIHKNGKLHLEEQDIYGKCRKECKTVAKACEESVGDVDTDLAEMLWQNRLSLSQVINKVCHSMSNACGKKVAPVDGNKWTDEDFIPMSEDERKADKILKQMRGMPGMPGMEMYSRDEIAKAKEDMMKQHGIKEEPQEERKELPIDEEGLLYESEGVSFFQMARDGLRRFWAWIRGLFAVLSKKLEL